MTQTINNKFLVSVADAILRDPNTDEALAYGVANIDSALTITMAETEVRGGINNPLLYTYKHDRKVDVKITQAIFTETILALNAGTNVLSGTVSVLGTDCIILTGDSGSVVNTPTGVVSVFFPNGTIQTVTPVGKGFTVSGGNSQRVSAVYTYDIAADRVTLETTTPPSVVDLTLIAEVRDNTGIIVNYLQINVPRFQVAGNYTLSLTANGVSNEALDGSALAVHSTDCTTGEYYATVTWIPGPSTSIAVSDIAVTPSTLTFSGSAVSKQLTALGIRGGIYSNIDITTSCSFVSSGSNAASFVSGLHTGLITSGSGSTSGMQAGVLVTYVDAANGTLTDTATLVRS